MSLKKSEGGLALKTEGQDKSKAGQYQGLTSEGNVKKRTGEGHADTPCRLSITATSTEPNHNRTITRADLPPDLQAVIKAWPDLPEAVKAGILAMVKASKK